VPINKEKAGKALEGLVKAGLPGDRVVFYANTVESGQSFAMFCLQTLGPEAGNRYLSEQYVEYLEYRIKAAFDNISVPEVMLSEISDNQEWHKIDHIATPEAFFGAEAAEPWHPSLREKHKPTPAVATWFNDRPWSYRMTVKVLTTVYKK
jgi:hypothetical protein